MLPDSYCSRGLTTKIAAHGDALRIDRPGELTSIPPAALIRKRANQLIVESDKRLQRRICTRARRLNSKSAIARLVFRQRDRDRVGAGGCRIDRQSS